MTRLLCGLLLVSLGVLSGPSADAQTRRSGFAANELRGAADRQVTEENLAAIEAAEQQHAAGEYDKSLATYRQVYGQLKGSLRQDDHPLLLEILSLVTDVFLDMGQLQQAEGTLLKLIEMRQLKLAKPGWATGEQSVERASLGASQVKLGLVLSQIGRLEEASEPLADGIATLEEVLGPQHRLVVESQLLAARISWNLGQFGKAVDLLNDVVERLPLVDNLDPEIALQAIEDNGEMLLSLGHVTTAIELWDRVTVDREARLPPDDQGLIVAYRRLGEAHLANGDLTAAESYWRQSLRISQQVFGEASGEAAADHCALSVVMRLKDQTVGAVNAYDQAVAGFGRAQKQGGVTPQQLRFCGRVGNFLLDVGMDGEAEQLLQFIDTLTESLGRIPEEQTIASATAVARCLLAQEKFAPAERLLREALANAVRELGKSHVMTLQVVELMAITAVRQGQHDLAANLIDVLQKAAPARQTADREYRLAETIAETADLLEQQEQAERAGQIRDRWLALRAEQYGEDGPELAESLVAFADSYQASGRLAEAVPLYERAVSLQEKAHGADHPSVAAVLLPLARALRAQRQDADAETAARRSLEIWEATLPGSHPVVVETLKMLTGSLYAQEKFAEVAPFYARLLVIFDQEFGPRSPQVEKLLLRLAEVSAAIGEEAEAEEYRQRAAAISGSTTSAGSR